MSFEVTPEVVIGVVMTILSLIFDYAPKVALWFDALEEHKKRLLVVSLAVVTVLVVVLGQCFLGWFSTSLECSPVVILRLVYDILVAVTISYSVHKTLKPSKTMRARLGLP